MRDLNYEAAGRVRVDDPDLLDAHFKLGQIADPILEEVQYLRNEKKRMANVMSHAHHIIGLTLDNLKELDDVYPENG